MKATKHKTQNRLDHLSIGQSATIVSFLDEEMSLKFLEMGCLPGERISIVRVAPLGDPIAISVSGYVLSMRREEAATIVISHIETLPGKR